MRGADTAAGSAIVLGNAQRGELIFTPNEDGTIEVCAEWEGGMTGVTMARSEGRRLLAFLKTELHA